MVREESKTKSLLQALFETGCSKVELLRSPDWKFLNTL